MEKRVLLAVFLSFLVLLVFQQFIDPPLPVEEPATSGNGNTAPAGEPAGPAPSTAASADSVASTDGSLPEEAAPSVSEAGPAPAAVVSDTEEHVIVVENGAIRAEFTNRGAELRSWRLKNYLDDAGQPVDLMPQPWPGDEPGGFALSFESSETTRRLHDALFLPSTRHLALGATAAERTLVFEYEDAAGLSARKTFVFGTPDTPYVVSVSIDVRQGGAQLSPTVHSGPGLGDPDAAGGGGGFMIAYRQPVEAIFQREDEVTRIAADDLAAQSVYDGQFRYIGIDDHYFLSVALPDGQPTRVEYRSIPGQAEGPSFLSHASSSADPTAVRTFYLGPKDFDLLAAVDQELVRVIHFGWFSFLVVPLLRALKWVNEFVHNYGWSIIILTILINLAIFPLRHKSVVSMRKMQAIKPEMKAIQARYANLKATDPARQKMNSELMALYRERGVNPASGCVPMVLTMPVLFAFYSLLSQAIELRGTPFIGWITDLSKHDPYYVTPLLMGASMVVQTRLTPSTADPTQQKVMMFMPIMFTFMFLWAPSGLVLYWLTSNVWAIGQQQLTNRWMSSHEDESKPPVERRVKKSAAKAGKTGSG